MSEQSPDIEREQLKALSHAWDARFQEKIDALVSRDAVSLDELFDVLWKDGVLGRLVPDQPDELAARVVLEKAVWPKGKDDPELYMRMMYAAEKVHDAGIQGHTIGASTRNFIFPAYQALLFRIYGDETGKIRNQFPGLNLNDEGNPLAWLVEKIEQRSRDELRRLGGDAEQPIIPIDSEGTFHGSRVFVESYTDNGGLWFKGATLKVHMALYDWMKDGGVSPMEVDPKDFHLPEKK